MIFNSYYRGGQNITYRSNTYKFIFRIIQYSIKDESIHEEYFFLVSKNGINFICEDSVYMNKYYFVLHKTMQQMHKKMNTDRNDS